MSKRRYGHNQTAAGRAAAEDNWTIFRFRGIIATLESCRNHPTLRNTFAQGSINIAISNVSELIDDLKGTDK